jgi:hypothetical protein
MKFSDIFAESNFLSLFLSRSLQRLPEERNESRFVQITNHRYLIRFVLITNHRYLIRFLLITNHRYLIRFLLITNQHHFDGDMVVTLPKWHFRIPFFKRLILLFRTTSLLKVSFKLLFFKYKIVCNNVGK